jgi:hypothetical protein
MTRCYRMSSHPFRMQLPATIGDCRAHHSHLGACTTGDAKIRFFA